MKKKFVISDVKVVQIHPDQLSKKLLFELNDRASQVDADTPSGDFLVPVSCLDTIVVEEQGKSGKKTKLEIEADALFQLVKDNEYLLVTIF